jgi:hypothetical protein
VLDEERNKNLLIFLSKITLKNLLSNKLLIVEKTNVNPILIIF